ncbi:hypothetical protein FQN51_002362 [Onygenales sp. PD_10]|nr:hypothetical protein FQN51_002362 [Onygenales sp. PD_10]
MTNQTTPQPPTEKSTTSTQGGAQDPSPRKRTGSNEALMEQPKPKTQPSSTAPTSPTKPCHAHSAPSEQDISSNRATCSNKSSSANPQGRATPPLDDKDALPFGMQRFLEEPIHQGPWSVFAIGERGQDLPSCDDDLLRRLERI